MAEPSAKQVSRVLLKRHGRTFAQEIGIPIEKGTPSPLFRLLCASLLFSARIGANIAVRATEALEKEGWTTPEKLANATWEERARTLNESGYARYDERTSAMLGDTSQLLLDRYNGDLRKLRETADRDPDRERRLIKEFKGIGDVGVDIFFREAQVAWDELYPFADKRALAEAKKLGLPDDAEALSRLVGKGDYPRLVAALVRTGLAKDEEGLLAAARSEKG